MLKKIKGVFFIAIYIFIMLFIMFLIFNMEHALFSNDRGSWGKVEFLTLPKLLHFLLLLAHKLIITVHGSEGRPSSNASKS